MFFPYFNFRFLVVLLLLLIASIVFARFIKTYLTFYSKFPNIFFMFVFLRSIFLGEKPENLPSTSFYFQKWMKLIKERQRGGFCLFWLHKPFLVVNNAEAIKFFSNEPSAAYKPPIYGIIKEFLGTSLLNSNGALWRKRRKMFNPVFKTAALKHKISIVNKNSKILVESLTKTDRQTSVAISEYLKIFAFSSILEFLSDIDFSGPERQRQMRNVMHYVDRITEMINYRIVHPWLLPKFTLKFFSKGREYLKEMEEGERLGEKLLQDVIEFNETKINSKDNDEAPDIRCPTFAELLVEYHLKDSSFKLKDMKDEFYNFLVAGYETVSYSLMWCLLLLGHHPEVQDQLYNELEGVMANDTDTLSYEDLQRLKYMDCVLKETNRIFPSVPIFARHLQKTVKFGDYTIPKGTHLAFISYLCQKDPTFFPNPDSFEPERFWEENSESYQWPLIPFGEGIRNCIGKKFAWMEMKVALAHILKNFKVTSVENVDDINLTWEIFLKAVEPVHVYLDTRQW